MNLMLRIGCFVLLVAVLSLVSDCFPGNIALAQGQTKKNTKYPQQVFIIRHAEKTGEETDVNLSTQAKQRAAVLHLLFVVGKDRRNPFPPPDFIFAASNAKNSHRPLETVTSLALKLKLPINQQYDSKVSSNKNNAEKNKAAPVDGMFSLRDEIFGQSKYFGKTILVSWRHSTIPELAKTLKVSNAPAKWADDIFDRVWQISYSDQGAATFVDRPQRLLPGDAEK